MAPRRQQPCALRTCQAQRATCPPWARACARTCTSAVVATSNTRTRPLRKPAAISAWCGWYATHSTTSPGASNSTSCCWLAMSHTRSVPSDDAVQYWGLGGGVGLGGQGWLGGAGVGAGRCAGGGRGCGRGVRQGGRQGKGARRPSAGPQRLWQQRRARAASRAAARTRTCWGPRPRRSPRPRASAAAARTRAWGCPARPARRSPCPPPRAGHRATRPRTSRPTRARPEARVRVRASVCACVCVTLRVCYFCCCAALGNSTCHTLRTLPPAPRTLRPPTHPPPAGSPQTPRATRAAAGRRTR